MKTTSIRFRLVSRLTLTLVAVAVLANAGLFIYLRGELIEQYDEALTSQAEAVTAVWRTIRNDAGAATAIADAFPKLRFGKRNGHYAWVRRADGTAVLAVPATLPTDYLQKSTPKSAVEYSVYDLTLPNGKAGRAIEVSVDAPTESATRPAGFKLILAESRREMDGTLASFALWLFVIGGGLSGAAIMTVLAIVQRELRPLGNFSDAVGQLDANSLDYRFPTSDLADELVPVSTRLNDLLQRLDAAFNRERRFTGNVAHELRTPLAELRSMVEVAKKWPPNPTELDRHHGNVLEVVQRMSTVTQALLTLVRSEGGRCAVSLTAVDLLPLLRAAMVSHERTAADRDVSFDFDESNAVQVLADSAILSSLFDNLFSNAAMYSSPGSKVTCRILVDGEGRAATIRLTNDVVDLNDNDLTRFDEPFWRKDRARSPSEHAGLGLALVRAYALAMHVEVSFRIEAAKRLVVDVVVPRHPIL